MTSPIPFQSSGDASFLAEQPQQLPSTSESQLVTQLLTMMKHTQALSETVLQQQRDRLPTAPIILQVGGAPTGGAGAPFQPGPADDHHHPIPPPVVPAQIETEIATIRSELQLMRSTLQQSTKGARTGVLVVTAILMTISLLAIIIIILAVLGFTGVLPQVALLMQGETNLIWAMVSGSIICFIALIGTLGLILTNKNTPLRAS
uniref:Inclusion Membrane Protein C n=1 Tax=Chlamydia pneumoniae TaxID=83558 RepID=A0A0F7X6W8_CHLPN|nr:Inclusion Membrane Protein C [Chlamydia pneumoniae]